MPSIFSTFNTLRRAMGAQQYAINTTSHNIANANTDGYSVQRATMQTTRPEGVNSLNSETGPGQLGTGVEVSEITRARDMFLDRQIRNEMSTSGKFTAKDEFLSEIETIFMEPSSNGISTYMGKMWEAWGKLSGNPENSNARTNVAESAKTLTDAFNHTYTQLEDLKDHSDELVQGQVFDFNNIITQIEALNKQIQGVRVTGANANDLMDKQDLLIDKLSGMANIEATRGSLGQVEITVGNAKVTGTDKLSLSYIKAFEKNTDGTYTMTYYNKGDITDAELPAVISVDQYEKLMGAKTAWTDADGKIVFEDSSGNPVTGVEKTGTGGNKYVDYTGAGSDISTAKIENGSINGYISILSEINDYESQLNALARVTAIAVNTLHNDPDMGNNLAFFTAGSSSDMSLINAGNITVNTNIMNNTSLIHTEANYIKTKPDGTPNPDYSGIGNGDRALAISRLRDTRIDINPFLGDSFDPSVITSSYVPYDKSNPDNTMKIKDDITGTTLDGFFKDTIAKLGSSSSQAKGMVTSQDALLSQLDGRKETISGVSMDEEMANLIQYQRAYQAAAKALSMMDELLNTVVNGLIR